MPEKPALLIKLLLARPLCVPCISQKSGLAASEIEPLLIRVQQAIFMKSGTERCRTCGNMGLVYTLFRKTEIGDEGQVASVE